MEWEVRLMKVKITRASAIAVLLAIVSVTPVLAANQPTIFIPFTVVC
jgi:hypothetical protein